MPASCRLAAALLSLACAGAVVAGELPAPPTAAQAYTEDQLLKWLGALKPVTREMLEVRVPVRFTPRQETRYRITWVGDISRVRNWFAEVDFVQGGDDAWVRLRLQPNNAINRARAQAVLGNFEPMPPPSPPPLSPTQGPIDNPVFSRVYARTRLSDGRTLNLVFEPPERGGSLFEAILSQPAADPLR